MRTKIKQIHSQLTCGRWYQSFHTTLWLCPPHSHQSLYTSHSETFVELETRRQCLKCYCYQLLHPKISETLESSTSEGGKQKNSTLWVSISHWFNQGQMWPWAGCTHAVHQHLSEFLGAYDALRQLQRVGGSENIHRAHHHLRGFTWRIHRSTVWEFRAVYGTLDKQHTRHSEVAYLYQERPLCPTSWFGSHGPERKEG